MSLKKSFKKKEKLSFSNKLKLYDEMYKYAVKMGAFQRKYIFDGLESKIRMAQILNGIYKGDEPIKKGIRKCLKKF